MSELIRVVGPDGLEEAAGTPGLRRRAAFEHEGYWSGHVEAAPATMSGWHHHGEMVTIGHVLDGRISLEFGPGGRRRVEVGPGDFFLVPPHVVHREGNRSDHPAEIVLVRIGEGDPVFPVDGPGG